MKHTTITKLSDMVSFYDRVNKDRRLAVGIEWERSGIYTDTLKPVPYNGKKKGYLAIMKKLHEEVGWRIDEGKSNYITALSRRNTRVTTEADGRLELTGSPNNNLHTLAREFRIHVNEVREMSNLFKIGWLPLGWQPFHTSDEIPMVSKKRYQIFMKLVKNQMLEDNMKKNNGLTASFSYTDEENAISLIQTAFRLRPIIGAMFASSPLNNKKVSKYLNYRRYNEFSYLPERHNFPKNILSKRFSLKNWIRYYLKLPVILYIRGGKELVPDRRLTFKQWIDRGYHGIEPTIFDFDQHIKTIWTDIRLRPGYVEYRVADSVPFRYVMSVPALVKGLFFDSVSRRQVYDLTKKWTYQDVLSLDKRAWKLGLRAKIDKIPLLYFAQEIIQIANNGLHKIAKKNSKGEDESIFLNPIKEQILIKEKSIAEEIRDLWRGEWRQNPEELIKYSTRSLSYSNIVADKKTN
ncbi:glutamate-cysteine ligase family protein [Patescibacteria group bacterium]